MIQKQFSFQLTKEAMHQIFIITNLNFFLSKYKLQFLVYCVSDFTSWYWTIAMFQVIEQSIVDNLEDIVVKILMSLSDSSENSGESHLIG